MNESVKSRSTFLAPTKGKQNTKQRRENVCRELTSTTGESLRTRVGAGGDNGWWGEEELFVRRRLQTTRSFTQQPRGEQISATQAQLRACRRQTDRDRTSHRGGESQQPAHTVTVLESNTPDSPSFLLSVRELRSSAARVRTGGGTAEKPRKELQACNFSK